MSVLLSSTQLANVPFDHLKVMLQEDRSMALYYADDLDLAYTPFKQINQSRIRPNKHLDSLSLQNTTS